LIGAGDVALPVCEPGLEALRRHRADMGAHLGVVAPAELGALAAEDARSLDTEPAVVRVARNRVGLAAELRDPPRVHDVAAPDIQPDRRPRGDDQLLVGEQATGVAIAPDVPLTDDLDLQLV
jgi:hypothetical protein